MKYIKTFESYNAELNSELIEEGWKEWLSAGLIALSSITGFYKLDQAAKEEEATKTEYATQINKTIDNMDEESVYKLITDFNSSEHGMTEPEINTGSGFERPYGTEEDRNDKGEFHTADDLFSKDIYGNDSIASARKLDFYKTNLKNQVKKDPSDFLISKDGKTVKLSPELQKTVGKWG